MIEADGKRRERAQSEGLLMYSYHICKRVNSEQSHAILILGVMSGFQWLQRRINRNFLSGDGQRVCTEAVL